MLDEPNFFSVLISEAQLKKLLSEFAPPKSGASSQTENSLNDGHKLALFEARQAFARLPEIQVSGRLFSIKKSSLYIG